jgi:hypothetical protein
MWSSISPGRSCALNSLPTVARTLPTISGLIVVAAANVGRERRKGLARTALPNTHRLLKESTRPQELGAQGPAVG